MPVSQQYLKNTKFEDFDPNEPDKSDVMWAIYDGTRFRTFAQRGHAISSFNNAYRAKMYEFVGGRWEERIVKYPQGSDQRPQDCQVCGYSTMEYRKQYNYSTKQTDVFYDQPKHNAGKYVWRRLHGKLTDPLELLHCCATCAKAVRNS